jgi:transcription factor E
MTNSDNVLRNVLRETLSTEHVAVVDELSEPQYDEDVAENLGIKATIVRTILNDLHENGLVEYHRTKNKKTGWYTYKWVRREDKIGDHIRNHLQTKLDDLNKTLEKENNGVTFSCKCGRVPYESAMESGFICNSCGQPYVEYNNSEVIDEIVQDITKINSMLQQISG